jgi:hypothetical protein
LIKKPASDFPNDQPIAKLKRKQWAVPQKTFLKNVKGTSSKQFKSLADAATDATLLLTHNYIS